MGDRYWTTLDCAYCDTENNIYYAESSGVTTFTCDKCGKVNEVQLEFKAVRSPRTKRSKVKENHESV